MSLRESETERDRERKRERKKNKGKEVKTDKVELKDLRDRVSDIKYGRGFCFEEELKLGNRLVN